LRNRLRNRFRQNTDVPACCQGPTAGGRWHPVGPRGPRRAAAARREECLAGGWPGFLRAWRGSGFVVRGSRVVPTLLEPRRRPARGTFGKARTTAFSTLQGICRALDCQPGDILAYRPDARGGFEPRRTVHHLERALWSTWRSPTARAATAPAAPAASAGWKTWKSERDHIELLGVGVHDRERAGPDCAR